MKTDAGCIAVVMVLLMCCLPAAAEPLAPQEYTVGNVLDRIERYQRNGLSHAREWHAGLERMTGTAAYLELALLEVYGPESVRNRPSGLERMVRLHHGDIGLLSDEVRRLLAVLSAEVEASLAAEANCRDLAGRLVEEQHGHRETREKLQALRIIERQLENSLDDTERDHDPNQ